MVEWDGRAQIAFPFAKPALIKMAGEVKLDGETWIIATVMPSRTAPKPPNGMVVVSVRSAAAP
jgi:hypothetical protein